MSTSAIFPSLSRNFSLDTSQTCEDDTIRDTMEAGYVATRPRFTRARRTWKANIRNLTIEDVRAIEHFRDEIVKRGALSFYLPNLIKNGSFEAVAQPGTGDVADLWMQDASVGGNVTLTAQAFDGNAAALFSTVAGQPASALNAAIARLLYGGTIAASPGDTVTVAFACFVQATTQRLYIEVRLNADFDDGTRQSVAVSAIPPAGISQAWTMLAASLVVPGSPTASLHTLSLSLTPSVSGGSTEPSFSAGEVSVLLDSVGAAVTATAQRQAQMLGSSPIRRPVRFTKLPEFADLGWVGGVKRYGTTFEATEL